LTMLLRFVRQTIEKLITAQGQASWKLK